MSAQGSIFDAMPASAEAEKERGMAVAAVAHPEELRVARDAARRVALADPERTADADRARVLLESEGVHLKWGAWAGQLFRDGRWEPTGRWVLSRFNRAYVMVWRLRQKGGA